jgi:hypothetical protein
MIDLPQYDAIRKHLLHYLASHDRVAHEVMEVQSS